MASQAQQAMLDKIITQKGFIAALDQSGGSTPKALKLYGIEESEYSNDEEMFDMVHAMRTRIVTCNAFQVSVSSAQSCLKTHSIVKSKG